jgi:hypothetical protein
VGASCTPPPGVNTTLATTTVKLFIATSPPVGTQNSELHCFNVAVLCSSFRDTAVIYIAVAVIVCVVITVIGVVAALIVQTQKSLERYIKVSEIVCVSFVVNSLSLIQLKSIEMDRKQRDLSSRNSSLRSSFDDSQCESHVVVLELTVARAHRRPASFELSHQ